MWSRKLEDGEAKARYWAVKIQPQWVVTPGKQKQTTNNRASCNNYVFLFEIVHRYCNLSERSLKFFPVHVLYIKKKGYVATFCVKFCDQLSQFNLSILRNSSVAPTSRVTISVSVYSMQRVGKCDIGLHHTLQSVSSDTKCNAVLLETWRYHHITLSSRRMLINM
jgi:hypothetical protein